MLRPKLNVVTLAAEFGDYAHFRTGTVAGPVAELAWALARLDPIEIAVEVRAIIPRYQTPTAGSAEYSAFMPCGRVAVTGAHWGLAECEVSACSPTERLSVWAIDYASLLDAVGVHAAADPWAPVPDPEVVAPADVAAAQGTALSFGLFCAAAVRLIQRWHEDEGWRVHVVHLQGWPVGPVAAMLEPGHSPAGWWPMWDDVGIWYTHHDVPGGEAGHFSAQSCGLDPAQLAERLGLAPAAVSRKHPRAILEKGIFSFPASALNYIVHGSHGLGINAVSPTHALELTRKSFGGRSAPLFQQARREGHLTGILGGIDLSDWDPRQLDPSLNPALDTEEVLAHKRDRSGLAARLAPQLEACRGDIEAQVAGDDRAGFLHLLDRAIDQKSFAVSDSDVVVVATQAATWRSGLDLFAHPEVADALLDDAELALKVVLIAPPDRADDEQSQALATLAERWPERVLYVPWWSDALERLLLRHADALLLPARVDPSGRAAMQAMRCFCVPIAHATGGLADVIVDAEAWKYGLSPPAATGFVFRTREAHDAPGFDAVARQALRARLGEMLECHRAFRKWGHPAWPALARNGFERTSREFSWEARAGEYLQHFSTSRPGDQTARRT